MYSERISALQHEMARQSVDLVLMPPSPNLFYLTDYAESQSDRPALLIVPGEGPASILTPRLTEDEFRYLLPGDVTFGVYGDGDDPVEVVATLLRRLGMDGIRTVAVENMLWAEMLLPLQQLLSGCTLRTAASLMIPLRRVKDAEELDRLRQAGKITDKVMADAIAACKVGATETDVAAVIEAGFRKYGGLPSGSNPVVASGPYSAIPHYRAQGREFLPGDAVVLDFGGFYKGYRSDMTRTVFIGEVSDKQREVYDIVRQAQQRTVEFIRPGVTCQDIDREARGFIRDKGYGEWFIHRTGHGLGVEVHEEPYIVEGNTLPVAPGMVHSVEPGLYFPGKFGVRVEDCVIVTDDGCERLTEYPRELIVRE